MKSITVQTPAVDVPSIHFDAWCLTADSIEKIRDSVGRALREKFRESLQTLLNSWPKELQFTIDGKENFTLQCDYDLGSRWVGLTGSALRQLSSTKKAREVPFPIVGSSKFRILERLTLNSKVPTCPFPVFADTKVASLFKNEVFSGLVKIEDGGVGRVTMFRTSDGRITTWSSEVASRVKITLTDKGLKEYMKQGFDEGEFKTIRESLLKKLPISCGDSLLEGLVFRGLIIVGRSATNIRTNSVSFYSDKRIPWTGMSGYFSIQLTVKGRLFYNKMEQEALAKEESERIERKSW